MQDYMITIWDGGKRWSEVVGTNNLPSLLKIYKQQYNRVMVTEIERWTLKFIQQKMVIMLNV